MKDVVICAMAKNEHAYINNWVKYNIELGFDHIYLYDNDDDGAPYIGDCIDKEYQDKITIFNVHNIRKHYFQVECYNEFYYRYSDTFSWCAFIDIDEFIQLNKWSNIKEFLSDPQFADCYSIALKWFLYGDDGFATRDITIPLQDFFKQVITTHKFSNQVKQITRGGLKPNIKINNHHCLYDGKLQKVVTPWGEPLVVPDAFHSTWIDYAHINHYMTKTLYEFLNTKFHRGDAMFNTRSITLDYYWHYNTKTLEKLQVAEQFLYNKKDVKIIVMSCDKNKDLFEPFFHCMEKYWVAHPEIIYSTETAINPYYKTIPLNYNLNQWTRRLRETIQQVGSKYVLIMVDDIFLRKPVEPMFVLECMDAFQNPNACGINFEGSFDRADKPSLYSSHLLLRNPNGKYKSSVMCQLFDSKKFLSLLTVDTDPWRYERYTFGGGYDYYITFNNSQLSWGWDHRTHFGIAGGKWDRQTAEFLTKEGLNIDFNIRGYQT